MMNAVWAISGLKTGEKFVLLSLADQANDRGEAFPSVSTIARRCSMTERTVFRLIAGLAEKGMVSVVSGGVGKSNRYCLTPDKLSPLTNCQDDKNDAEPLTNCHPNHKKNHQTNIKRGSLKPTVEEAEAFAAEIGLEKEAANRFHDYYESKGWRVGNHSMKSWKAAMRNWQRNQRRFDQGGRKAEHREQQENIQARSL